MTMFLLTPDGPIALKETLLPPCPECGGKQTTVCTSHKMSCSAANNKRQCVTCGDWYSHGPEPHSCTANNIKELRRLSDGPPRPKALFDVPPRPRDNRWRVEWRWKHKKAISLRNDWQEHRGDKAPATRRIALNQVAVLRGQFPGKSWRVRGVKKPTPEQLNAAEMRTWF